MPGAIALHAGGEGGGRLGRARPDPPVWDPTGAQLQLALDKRNKSQQAEHVHKSNDKSNAFRNGFNYSEAARQGSLP